MNKSDDECMAKDSASSSKDCEKLQSSRGHCCYINGKNDEEEIKRCISLTKEEYDNIDDYIKKLENDGSKVKDLDCKSYYLELCLLSLLFILL